MKKLLFSALLCAFALPVFASQDLPACENCDTHSEMAVFDVIAEQLQLKPTDFEHRDLLDSDEQRYYTLMTEPKRTYYLVAVCDGDCSDLDIGVWHDDERVEVDYEMDAYPVVKFSAKHQSYRVRVDMEDCSTDACFAHVKAYVK